MRELHYRLAGLHAYCKQSASAYMEQLNAVSFRPSDHMQAGPFPLSWCSRQKLGRNRPQLEIGEEEREALRPVLARKPPPRRLQVHD